MNKRRGNDLLKSFNWIKEKRAPQHSEGYLHIPLKPSHALQLASFQVIRNYSGSLLKSRFKRIELGVTQTVHANYVFLIKVKSSNNNNNNNTRKKLQGLLLAPDEKTYQDNIVNTFVQFYAGIFVRHMQSLRLFLVYGSGFKVQ